MDKLQRANILSRIVGLARQDDSVRAIILIGSLARAEKPDILSDVDLSIFTTNIAKLTNNTSWINCIDVPLVVVPEKVIVYGRQYPTRLVIFENCEKVDFGLFDIDLLQRLVRAKTLPPEYNAGYRILLDKDAMAAGMQKAQGFSTPAESPNEAQFLSLVEEFWFEAYHVAKYLKRQDLMSAKFREHGLTDKLLVKMIEWNAAAKSPERLTSHPNGRDMKMWVENEIWKALAGCFAEFNVQDGWQALMNTIALYRRLARETGRLLGYGYPEKVDMKLSGYIEDLAKEAAQA